MDSVIRAAIVYGFVRLVFRIAGKRSVAEITTFDFVLLLIISETTQTALVKNDNSITNAMILIVTIVGLDQPPASQRADRRKRVPVRRWQYCERDAERSPRSVSAVRT